MVVVGGGGMRIRHSKREFATQPVILWILLGGKPKWLPLNFGLNDVMRTAPIIDRLRCYAGDLFARHGQKFQVEKDCPHVIVSIHYIASIESGLFASAEEQYHPCVWSQIAGAG